MGLSAILHHTLVHSRTHASDLSQGDQGESPIEGCKRSRSDIQSFWRLRVLLRGLHNAVTLRIARCFERWQVPDTRFFDVIS